MQLVYSTYVGGDGIDKAYGIALDSSNNAYITGSTTSKTSFPITSGAYQITKIGTDNITGQDAFIVKINPDPTKSNDLKYGTYFGGAGTESGNGIAVNADGTKVYFVGSTTSTQANPNPFPLKLEYQNTNNGGTNGQDAFAAAINPAGTGSSDLIFSTYLGGTTDDSANAVAVDANARVYVVGTTSSADMFSTVLTGTGYGGGKDAFVASLDNTYTTLYYAAYLGGGGDDEGRAIALDSIANAYVVGDSASTDFPVTSDAEQKSNAGGQDAFLSVIGTEADVGITSFTGTSPAPALLQPLTYTVNITNFGPDTATGATLTVNLSTAGLNDPSNPPTFNNPNCQSTNSDFSSFSCSLGTLTSNQLVTITITGTLTTAASMTATATVTADQLDTNSGNNSLAWEVTAGTSSQPVTPPTTVGGGGSSSGGGSLNPGALAMLGLLALYACITGQRRHPRGGVARSIPAITRSGRRAATTQR